MPTQATLGAVPVPYTRGSGAVSKCQWERCLSGQCLGREDASVGSESLQVEHADAWSVVHQQRHKPAKEAGKIAEEEAVHAVLVTKREALFVDKHEWTHALEAEIRNVAWKADMDMTFVGRSEAQLHNQAAQHATNGAREARSGA